MRLNKVDLMELLMIIRAHLVNSDIPNHITQSQLTSHLVVGHTLDPYFIIGWAHSRNEAATYLILGVQIYDTFEITLHRLTLIIAHHGEDISIA
jgi:hypothetical protein